MTPKLSDEILQALQAHPTGPIRVENPHSGEVYWIVTNAQMEQLRPLFEADPLSTEEKQELLRRAGKRAGWDDREMDVYDNYDEHRSQSS